MEKEAEQVARLLGMETEQVVKILTSKLLVSQKELVEAKLSPLKAKYSRDALAKVLTTLLRCICTYAVSYKLSQSTAGQRYFCGLK